MANPFAEIEQDGDFQPADVVKTAQTVIAAEVAKDDITELMDLPSFHRFLLTLLKNAGIDDPYYGMQHSDLASGQGRRNLGFEVLAAIREKSPGVDLILAVEKAKTLENANDRRQQRPR